MPQQLRNATPFGKEPKFIFRDRDSKYAAYFNGRRPHQGLQQRVPAPESVDGTVATGEVVALSVLGGLHHEYRRAA